MTLEFRPQGVCARAMAVDIEHGTVRALRVEGGCPGNLQGIARLVEGMPVGDVIRRLSGIRCGGRPTSCPDQLARALAAALPQGPLAGAPAALR